MRVESEKGQTVSRAHGLDGLHATNRLTSERTSYIASLSSVKPRTSKELAFDTARAHPLLTVETRSTAGGEGRNDTIPDFEVDDGGMEVDDCSSPLVAL